MINRNTIDELFVKMGLNEYDYTVNKQDDSGDFIDIFSPELSFQLVKKIILENKFFNTTITDIGPNAVIMTLKDIVNGTNFFYTIKFISDISMGTYVKAGIKRIDYYNKEGNYKPFVSFEMMNSYIKTFEDAS